MQKIITLLMLIVTPLCHAEIITNNKSPNDLFQLAKKKNSEGLLIQAHILLTNAIAIDDQQHRYFQQRGMSYFGMGEVESGIKDYKQAVDLKSDVLEVYLKLIKHYMSRSQFMLVSNVTDQMLVNLPEQAAGAYFYKGKAYEAAHKYALAIQSYEMSIAELGDDQADFKQLLLEKIFAVQQQGLMQ